MVPLDEAEIVEKGRVGPGQMIGVDLDAAAALPRPRDQGPAGRDPRLRELGEDAPSSSNSLIGRTPPAAELSQPDELRRRQVAVGWTLEDLELILQPMVEDGKEAVGSMGDDTPLAVLSDRYRGLHHFFRQNFSQVTNPPIDSLRERRVMTLKTRLGNLGNILDEDPEQCELLSAGVAGRCSTPSSRRCASTWARPPAEIDCTFERRQTAGATPARGASSASAGRPRTRCAAAARTSS